MLMEQLPIFFAEVDDDTVQPPPVQENSTKFPPPEAVPNANKRTQKPYMLTKEALRQHDTAQAAAQGDRK